MSIIKDHFNALFSAPTHGGAADFLESLSGQGNEEMNEDLIKPYKVVEFNEALKQMHLTKAPGPDGMSPIFYQKFLHVIGSSI